MAKAPREMTQALVGSCTSAAIGEAMEARVKDPLWFLARQWQTGEFEAENGGHLTNVAIEWGEIALDSVERSDGTHKLDLDTPLEAQVEAEIAGEAPAWVAETLEYRFALTGGSERLEAADYSGFALDWYHFEMARSQDTRFKRTQSYQTTPTTLPLRGAPNPRWWQFESGDDYFDAPRDAEPNVLSTLLPELFYTDINNWYLVPLTQRAGTVRKILGINVVDSFGTVTQLPPAVQPDGDWHLFVLSCSGGKSSSLDGSWLFIPNIAAGILHNDTVEDVRFIRSEAANIVWACERLVKGDTAAPIVNGDGHGDAAPAAPRPGPGPTFHLASLPARHWIPYVPRFKSGKSATDGETYLRRARTRPDATVVNPQYRGQIVAESWRVNEEEIPPSGVRVRRIFRYAPGCDGAPHFWVGRHKDTTSRIARPKLKFDYLD